MLINDWGKYLKWSFKIRFFFKNCYRSVSAFYVESHKIFFNSKMTHMIIWFMVYELHKGTGPNGLTGEGWNPPKLC